MCNLSCMSIFHIYLKLSILDLTILQIFFLIWDLKFNLELISKHLTQNILIFVFPLDLIKDARCLRCV